MGHCAAESDKQKAHIRMSYCNIVYETPSILEKSGVNEAVVQNQDAKRCYISYAHTSEI